MTASFSIDCHACGAKNTIDTETMRRVNRRVEPVREMSKAHEPWCLKLRDDITPVGWACNCRDYTLVDPEPAA